MDLGLKDFAATLAIGVYALGGLLVVCLLVRPPGRKTLAKWLPENSRWIAIAVATVASFGVGVVIEDSSDRYFSDRAWFRIPSLLGEDKLKAEALFKECKPVGKQGQQEASKSSNHNWHKLNELGISVWDRGLFDLCGKKHSITASMYFPDKLQRARKDDLVDAAKAAYHFAKGRVYQDDNYFSEMSRIQLRIAFVRSAIFISVLLAFFTLLLLPFSRRTGYPKWMAGVLLALGVIALVTLQTFWWEEGQFNNRAFGYWAVMNPRTQGRGNVEGISGMAHLRGADYVVVHDTKRGQCAPHFGVVSLDQPGMSYRELDVVMGEFGQPPDDLESICRIPPDMCPVSRTDTREEPAHFLASESRVGGNGFLKVYHISILQDSSRPHGRLHGIIEVALPPKNAGGTHSVNIEGVACAREGDEVILLLGNRVPRRRDGSIGGTLFLVPIDLERHETIGDTKTAVFRARDWPQPVYSEDGYALPDPLRVCADLYVGRGVGRRKAHDPSLGQEASLWIAAASDVGNSGPFRSIIYQTSLPSYIDPQGILELRPMWRVDGAKVEALAAPSDPDRGLTIGMDDEDFGGTWRSLPRSKTEGQ